MFIEKFMSEQRRRLYCYILITKNRDSKITDQSHTQLIDLFSVLKRTFPCESGSGSYVKISPFYGVSILYYIYI